MGKIHILDEDLINKIAAGEVIERPASIIKELIENSIDAGATKISIETRDAGTTWIRVQDNGEGMDEPDAKLCFQRHTTSKISLPTDLFSIKTLGFRGEALASIAAVSKVKILTKTASVLEGTCVDLEGGKLKKASKLASIQGTIIEIKELFYNTPVRLRHLDSLATENRHIADIVTRYSLNYPQIFFRLSQDGKTTINSPATGNTLANIANIYGHEFAKQLVPINYSNGEIEIMGFIGKPGLTKADTSGQSFFVNGRYVKSELLSTALYDACHTLIMVNRFPVAILNLAIDPKTVDVNIHPAKQRVKFGDDKKIYAAVFGAVRQALQEGDLFAEAEVKAGQKMLVENIREKKQKKAGRKYELESSVQSILEKAESKKEEELPVRILGVIYQTYIIAEDKENLLLIDQHAMHERILYEKFMEQFMAKDVGVQQLIVPLVLELSPAEMSIIEANLEALKALGFAIDSFGKNTISVRTMPAIFGRQQDKEIISDLLAELKKSKARKIDEIKEQIITKMACRAAIKAGDDIPAPRLKELLAMLYKTKSPYTCPHGRPIIIKFPITGLEKQFKRVV